MKMTDMRAKARAIFGPANPEPMPNQPNGAKALQERANARPIPTYKVGGSVKKPTPPQPTAAEREAERKRRESLAKAKVTQSEADTLGRAMRSEGPGYKHGGKIAPASPNQIPKTGKKIPISPPKISRRPTSDELERRYDKQREIMLDNSGYKHGGKIAKYKQGSGSTKGSSGRGSEPLQNLDYNLLSGSGGGGGGGSGGFRLSPTAISQPSSSAASMAGQGPPKGYGLKVTKKFKKGGAMKPVDEAKNPGLKKLPTEVRNKMGYMKKGGDPKKSGLAVMIAIGSPMKGMKKPVKKMHGGRMHDDGDKPEKFAQGGAGKVRKGMMTPEGKIVDAMNKVRGK